MQRYTLLNWRGRHVYLHHWLNDDWSVHHHDHSRAMWSIGLWGRYTEHLHNGAVTKWRAPWIRRFPATHRHYITLDTPMAWTLVFAGPIVRFSGFWVGDQRFGAVGYLQSPHANQQKRC